MNYYKPYSKGDLAEIRSRKARGELFTDIAASLGRPYNSMIHTLHNDEKGSRKGTREETKIRSECALQLLKRGHSISEIAALQKRSRSAICNDFDSQGIHSEARRNIIAKARHWKWLKSRTRESRLARDGVRVT